MSAENQKKILVAGAGGFIGSHMVRYLKAKGFWVRGADIKLPEFRKTEADDFIVVDLRDRENCLSATKEIHYVYDLAANMGGIGFITDKKAEIMRDNVLINTNMLEASLVNKVQRFFFSSSACVYATYKQESPDIQGLKEEDAYPAQPDNEYGWEKLFTERLCKNYFLEFGMETRVARFHNIYGPYGTFDGGREKSPAAICRKVAMAKNTDSVEIWGDGKQTRSYCYIDDCTEGVYKLMNSDFREPLNIGSDRLISVDGLADIVIRISGKNISRTYNDSMPQGVRGRNSDNTLLRQVLHWEPGISLEEGLKETYMWIEKEVGKRDA